MEQVNGHILLTQKVTHNAHGLNWHTFTQELKYFSFANKAMIRNYVLTLNLAQYDIVQVSGSKKCLILEVSLTHLLESWDPLYKLLQGVSYVVGWGVLKIMRTNKKCGTFLRGGYNPN